MTAEIVNLNQYRKARDKREETDKAAENRRKFGRTKSEKLQDEKTRRDADKELDGKELLGDPSGDDRGTSA